MEEKQIIEGNKLIAVAKEIYAYQKAHWSRPVDEDSATNHLGYEDDGTIFCGVDKRYEGIYNIGFNPIEHLEKCESNICKTCFKVWKSRHNSTPNK